MAFQSVLHLSRKLERLQERTLRLVCNTTTDSYDTLLKRAKLTTLQNKVAGHAYPDVQSKKLISKELFCEYFQY